MRIHEEMRLTVTKIDANFTDKDKKLDCEEKSMAGIESV